MCTALVAASATADASSKRACRRGSGQGENGAPGVRCRGGDHADGTDPIDPGARYDLRSQFASGLSAPALDPIGHRVADDNEEPLGGWGIPTLQQRRWKPGLRSRE
jgi:hypothetical protein